MGEIAHPHDHFVKVLLSNPEKAGTFLREWLPKEIAELLSPDPPELVSGVFVDEELREHLTDRLFKVKTVTGRVAMLHILIDHKSSPDRKVGWQFQKYMTKALEQWVMENPDWTLLPAIVPFLFYHGATKWKIPDEFLALVDAEEGWRPYLLNFQFPVFDLGEIPDKKLSSNPNLRAWLLAVKYATRKGRQLEKKEYLVEVLADAGEDFPVIVRYMMETYQSYGEEIFREIIRRVRPEEETKMMSQFAQEIIAKGKPEWAQMVRQEGRREESASMLSRLLQRRFREVPSWASEKIAKADLPTLEEWSLRTLDAQSLEDVFGS